MNNEALKILLVEDSNTDAVLLKEHILLTEKNIDLNQTGSLQEAFDFISKNHVDAILLDLSLPDSHGLGTIEKTIKAFPRLPIVVLTGIEDETVGVQAVRLGASDYLVKGRVDGEVIIRALNYSIERKTQHPLSSYHRRPASNGKWWAGICPQIWHRRRLHTN
jgi:DNA-binding response OmpR family regulator